MNRCTKRPACMNITRRPTTYLEYFYAGYYTITETRTGLAGVMAVVLNQVQYSLLPSFNFFCLVPVPTAHTHTRNSDPTLGGECIQYIDYKKKQQLRRLIIFLPFMYGTSVTAHYLFVWIERTAVLCLRPRLTKPQQASMLH